MSTTGTTMWLHYQTNLQQYRTDETRLLRFIREGRYKEARLLTGSLGVAHEALTRQENDLTAYLATASEVVEDTIHLPVPDSVWRPIGTAADPTSRLLATLAIGEMSMHFEAWAVAEPATVRFFGPVGNGQSPFLCEAHAKERGYDWSEGDATDEDATCDEADAHAADSTQDLADELDDEGLSHLQQAVGGIGAFETHAIGGRRYILVATPYCT